MQAGNIERLAGVAQFRAPGESRFSRVHPVMHEPRDLGPLIVDSKGLVFFCSEALASLIGSSSAEIIGTEVRDFMPALPFDPSTEGYNVAFGVFCAARRCRQAWTLLAHDGATAQLEGYFAMLKMPSGYLFCLELHQCTAPGHFPCPGTAPCNRPRSLPGAPARVRTQVPRQPHLRTLRHAVPGGPDARAMHSARPPHVQLLLDRDYRVGFASSAIEDLLAHDYENVIGMHVSEVLPELLPRLGGMCSVRSAKAKLRDMGGFFSCARHVDGRDVPVIVQLGEKKCAQLIPLLISAPA